jgi:beta-lactamase regulating signal transducer with metallopeptidase domain
MLALGTVVYRRQRARVIGSGTQLARLGRIRILRSEAIRGPMAFGIIDPVIALPEDFDQRFDERQRRLTLDHELAHHRSGDLVANLIAYVLLCLQWFNPLAWVAHAAFRFDQEAACDARVLDMIDGPDRAAYGQAIAKAASGRALLFAGALDRPKTLSRRLQSMLIFSHPRRRLAGRALILACAAVALPLTATWATRYIDIEASTPPTAAALL